MSSFQYGRRQGDKLHQKIAGSDLRIGISAAVLFALVFVISWALDSYVSILADNLVSAALCSLAVAKILLLYRERQNLLQQKLLIIAQLNHEIRNSLQPILYLTHDISEDSAKLICECVNKISQTMHVLVPMVDDRRLSHLTTIPTKQEVK